MSSLSSRIFALIAAVSLAGMGALSYEIVRVHTADLERAVVRGGLQLSQTLVRSTRLGMLHNRKQDVYGTMETVGAGPGIERIRIYSKLGSVVFSTEDGERGRVVDTRAEACTRCHINGADPVVHPDETELSRIFEAADGHRVLGLITPIYNEPGCANAACHPSPAEQNILGVMDLQMSLAAVDAAMAEGRDRFLFFVYSLMLLLAGLSGWFVYRWVHLPVKELIRGTERVRAGHLDYRIPLRSRTEIGRLASSFNQMSEELATANRQLTEWARTLEERVEQKTAALQQAQARLVHNEKMASLGTLSAVVAHEINNPLSGVLTYAKLVRRRLEKGAVEDTEKLSEYLITIERETSRCGNIVRNLLEFSRQSGVAAGDANVNDILERTLFLINHKLELQGIRLERRIDEDLPQITCDAEQIQQALLALLMNAVEAMSEGGHLTVTTMRGTEGERAGWIGVEVSDDGVGIPEEVLPQIFEPFFSTKHDKHGVGLGLSVVHGIARRHKGEIDVASDAGGTRFTLWLPPRADLEERLAMPNAATTEEGIWKT